MWSCVGLDLQPFDCSVQEHNDEPAPAGALRGLRGRASSNSACGMRVKIPPLNRGGAGADY